MQVYDIYKCFGMYNRMCQDTQSSKQEIALVIENYAIDISIIDFIFDYKSISYNENNIYNYFNFVLYLDYNKTDEYIDYITKEYILKCNLLEQIKHFEIIKDKLNKICSNENNLTDNILIYINKNIPITDLNANCNNKITDKSVKYLTNLTNLTNLNARHNEKITDESVKYLTNLTNLNARHNEKITDESIKHLINLTELDATYNNKITDESIKHLIILTTLNACGYNSKITDESVKHLINLTTLDANYNEKITDESVKQLTNLTKLNAHDNSQITIKSCDKLKVFR